jgi:hypothetical protein
LHIDRICEWLERLRAYFDGNVSEARNDRMIGMALDEFQRLHEEERVPQLPRAAPASDGIFETNERLLRLPFGWRLQQQLLWHLALISHPVEADVLASAPQVMDIANQLLKLEAGTDQGLQETVRVQSLVAQAVDVLVRRCMVFRLNAVDVVSPEVILCQSLSRPGFGEPTAATATAVPPAEGSETQSGAITTPNWRFAVHRFMQRAIFIRLHAPFVEQSNLDQEGLSLWVSQPDDLPRPSRHALDQLDSLLSDWIGLP